MATCGSFTINYTFRPCESLLGSAPVQIEMQLLFSKTAHALNLIWPTGMFQQIGPALRLAFAFAFRWQVELRDRQRQLTELEAAVFAKRPQFTWWLPAIHCGSIKWCLFLWVSFEPTTNTENPQHLVAPAF